MITKIAAHRGLTDSFQENTVEAISAAAELDVDMIEFDTHRSKDGIWVLYHDEYIGDEENLIKNLRYDEIVNQLNARGKEVDLLEEVLNTVNNVHLNIECKSEGYEDGVSLAQYLSTFDLKHTFNVSSFSRDALHGLYDTNDELNISYLGYLMPFFRWQWLNRKIPLYSINPYRPFLFRWKVNSAHRRDIEVHAWTINKSDDIIKCFELGIDVIITDNPVKAMKLRSEYYE